MKFRAWIKKIDAMRLTSCTTELQLDERRKQADPTSSPIATFDQDVTLTFVPNGNAGYYQLNGQEAALRDVIANNNITPLQGSLKAVAETRELAGASA